MSEPSEHIVSAGLSAAREARSALADGAHALQPEGDQDKQSELSPMVEELTTAIGELYAVEQAEPEQLHDSLEKVLERLREVLPRLHEMAEHSEPARLAAETVAGTLTELHPSYSELRRALGRERSSAPSPSAHPPKPTDEGHERREAHRVDLEAGVGFHSETNFFTGFTGNISEGGLFVATYEVQPIGTPLTLSFILPDGTQVTASGHVKWVREPLDFESDLHPGMGVAFDSLSDAERDAIHRFIELREPLFHENEDED